MQEKLDRLETLVNARNATDFLDDLITNYDLFFGRWLVEKSLQQRHHQCGPECDGFEDDIIQ